MANFTTTGSNVYPAGHILQQVAAADNDAFSSSTDGWSQFMTWPRIQITASHASNKIILIGTTSVTKSASTNMSLSFYKNASDVTENYNISGETYGFGYWSSSNTGTEQRTIHMLDTAGTTNQITYHISYRSWNSNSSTAGQASGATKILAMEVMR